MKNSKLLFLLLSFSTIVFLGGCLHSHGSSSCCGSCGGGTGQTTKEVGCCGSCSKLETKGCCGSCSNTSNPVSCGDCDSKSI